MMTLVTGATGFIGSVLVMELLARGHGVRALAMQGEDTSALEKAGVEIRRGDLMKKESLKGICTGADAVIHCAARVTDWGTKKQFYDAIYGATKNLLEEADGDSNKFMYLSSIAALGMGRHLKGAPESQAPRKSGVPYNDAKADTEILARKFHDTGRISCTIIRPANVTGPGSVWVRDIIDRMLSFTGIPLIDGGIYNSSFVYVDSLVDGIIRAAESDSAAGKTYHFRDDWDVTWKRYITDLGSFIGKVPRGRVPFHVAWTVGLLMEKICNPPHLRSPLTRVAAGVMGRDNDVDTARAKAELGWKTVVPYENAIGRIGEWVARNYPRA
jgi:2-alkyl-3-oxoalkanoate reductase